MIPPWVERTAAGFWETVGGMPPPPRDVEPLLPLFGPVWVRPTHPVTPSSVRDWLRRRGRPLPPGFDDVRPLLGCVVAYRGWCAIVVDDRLPADERRAVVAHELGHYLADYHRPRDRLLRRFGPAVLPILDGDRTPTPADEWAAALAGVRFGLHAHYLERNFTPNPDAPHHDAERSANDLALELLAPWREVLTLSGHPGSSLQPLLAGTFGLPCSWAAGYARRLLRLDPRTRSPSRAWGL